VLDQPEAQLLLAKELLAVVEMKEKQVIAVGELIPQLYKADLLDKDVMVKAFQEFMQGYEDLVIDVPQAPSYVVRLLVRADIGLSEACGQLPSPTCLEKAYATLSSP
jgi:translation initiation factor 4G